MSEYASLERVALRFADPHRTESIAELVATLSPEDQRELMGDMLDDESFLYDWKIWARPKQLVSDDPYYNVTLFLTGRGFGKTRAGCEWVRQMAMSAPDTRIGVLGRTSAEVRDVIVHGESGLLNIPQPEDEKPIWKPSEVALYYPNGSVVKLYSAEKGDAIRGSQHHAFLVDELASYSPFVGPDGLTAFDNARLATRLGEKPQIVITTTPKKVKILRELLTEAEEKGTVKVVRGSTNENKSNLSSVYMDVMYGQFGNTAIAKQELDGEMLDEDIEGALWTEDTIKHVHMTDEEARRLPIRVVAVDPTVASEPHDECGIVVVGATDHRLLHKRTAYVLEDATLQASPEVWAQKVVDTWVKWNAHAVVIEKNQGHDLLRMAIHNINPNVKVLGVNAGSSKKTRAEPVSQVYEQGRVKHLLPGYPLLESQMLTWEPEISKKSPDRVDALVWGVLSTLVSVPKGLVRGKVTARSMSGNKLPSGIGTGTSRASGLTRKGGSAKVR